MICLLVHDSSFGGGQALFNVRLGSFLDQMPFTSVCSEQALGGSVNLYHFVLLARCRFQSFSLLVTCLVKFIISYGTSNLPNTQSNTVHLRNMK